MGNSTVKFLGVLVTALIVQYSALAQIEKIWEKPISKRIVWQQVTSLGNLIVCTNEALEGVNTEDGSITWDINQLGAISQQAFEELPGSPYFKVNLDERFYLIDQFSGKVVFDSKSSGIYDISGIEVLPKAGIFLVSGNTPNQDQLVLAVDLSDASILWKKTNEFKVILGLEELTNQEFVLVSVMDVYRMKAKTGEVVWKNTIDATASEQMEKMGGLGKLLGAIAEEAVDGMQDDFIIRLFKSPDRDFYIIGAESRNEGFDDQYEYSTIYRAYRLSDGGELWRENMQVGRKKFKEMAKTIEMDGKMGHVIFQQNDFLILSNHYPQSVANRYDYDSGKGKWGRVERGLEEWGGTGVKVRGSIYEYLETQNGILLATRLTNNYNPNSGEHFLSILDPITGSMKTKRPTKIEGEIAGIVEFQNDVFYVSEDAVNFINKSTGQLHWKKGIRTNPELTAEKDGKIYLHDKRSGGLKVLDLQSKSLSDLNINQLNFKGKEVPENLELRDDGIVLYSSQNIAKYGYDGNLLFNNYFPAPRESGFQIGLNIAGAILMAFVAADSYYSAGQIAKAEGRIRADSPEWSEFAGQLKNAYSDQGDDAADAMMSALNALKNRKKASESTKDYNLIMTKRDKNIELLQVSKSTGESEGTIILGRDRDPVYAIDQILGHVYYLESGKNLVAYKLN